MAPPIRIECRFCNHPFHVDARLAGQRIKCPKCKNTLAVPVEAAGDAVQVRTPAVAGAPTGQDKRPIAGRHARQRFAGYAKLLALALIVVAGWFGWRFYKEGESMTPLELLEESANPDTSKLTRERNRLLVLEKAREDESKPEWLQHGKKYATHKEPHMRALAAEILGTTKLKKAFDPLAKLVTDKELEVRKAACGALGEIRLVESVESLVGVVSDEKEDTDVRSDAKTSLQKLTGQTISHLSEWKGWWGLEKGKGYQLSNPAK